MHYKSLFPSKYVAASDLHGQDAPVQIVKIVQEEVGETKDVRPVLFFAGCQKGMVLNATNAKRIVRMYGEETDLWLGKTIVLYESETEFKGETVPCIRVRDTTKSALGAATTATRTLSPEAAADFDAMKAKLEADLAALTAKQAGTATSINPVEQLMGHSPNGQHVAASVGGAGGPRF